MFSERNDIQTTSSVTKAAATDQSFQESVNQLGIERLQISWFIDLSQLIGLLMCIGSVKAAVLRAHSAIRRN